MTGGWNGWSNVLSPHLGDMLVDLFENRTEIGVFLQHGLAKFLTMSVHLFEERLLVRRRTTAHDLIAFFQQILALAFQPGIIFQRLLVGVVILGLLGRSKEGPRLCLGLGVNMKRRDGQQNKNSHSAKQSFHIFRSIAVSRPQCK